MGLNAYLRLHQRPTHRELGPQKTRLVTSQEYLADTRNFADCLLHSAHMGHHTVHIPGVTPDVDDSSRGNGDSLTAGPGLVDVQLSIVEIQIEFDPIEIEPFALQRRQ